MRFDFSKLRGRIIEKFGTYANFAAAVGYGAPVISAKLSNQCRISMADIYKWIQPQVLDIPPEEISVYFFTPEVR